MKSTDIFDTNNTTEFDGDDDFAFVGMDFSDHADGDISKLIYLPVHSDISPDAPIVLVSNSFTVTSGTWDEVSRFIVDSWNAFNGVYSIVDGTNGNTLHTFTVAR